jgi:hypothetical protein
MTVHPSIKAAQAPTLFFFEIQASTSMAARWMMVAFLVDTRVSLQHWAVQKYFHP